MQGLDLHMPVPFEGDFVALVGIDADLAALETGHTHAAVAEVHAHAGAALSGHIEDHAFRARQGVGGEAIRLHMFHPVHDLVGQDAHLHALQACPGIDGQ